MQASLWGLDLGGTKLEGVILPSLLQPTPILRQRIDTESFKGYEHIIGQIERLIREMKEASGLSPRAVGIGTPGVLDPVLQTMKNCNTTVLNGKPFQKDLEEKLQIPVILANDANCFALAETHWGAVREHAKDARMVFGIIMGTGVGGGIVMDGKVWNGRHGIAGEWGHNFLDASGGPCYCGQTGCVETILSGPALEKFYAGRSGHSLPLQQIVARAADGGDLPAIQTLQRCCYFFGKAVSVITNLLDPDTIVLGGGVGNIPALYVDGLASLQKFIFNPSVETPLLRPRLGDSAGVFGAAALVG